MDGYRGFESKAEYIKHYSNLLPQWELDAMAAYTKEAEEERENFKMELSETEKLAMCKYNCLVLACGRFKIDGDGNQINLDATEVLDVANKFYNFVIGDK